MRREVGRGVSAVLVALWLLLSPAPAGAVARARSAGPPAGPAPRDDAQAEPAPTPPPRSAGPGVPKAEAAPGEEVVVLSLQDCLKQALENNLDIAVRRYDPLRSEVGVTFSQAAFDPALVGGTTSRQDQSKRSQTILGAKFDFPQSDRTHTFTAGFLDPLTTGGFYRIDVLASDDLSKATFFDFQNFRPVPADSRTYTTSWTVTFSQPLLRNLGPDVNRWQIVIARNTLGQSESRFRQQVIETLAAAEKAYWDLDFALLNLKTQQTSQQLARDFLEENRIKVRVGTLAPIEITQAEAGVADREEAVIEAGNLVRTSEDALRRIVNVPQDSPLWSRPIQPSDAPSLVEVTPELQEAVSAAMERRPDLEQSRLDLKSRETELAYRDNQRRWDLSFQGDYGVIGFDPATYDDSFKDLRQHNQDTWALALNLTIPIGNRQAVANYTNAEYAREQARYTLQNLEQGARVEVRTAVRTVETNLKRVKAAQVNTRLQREKLDAEQKKFNNGMSTSFQVLSFQNDLASAESRENQAVVDYNKSLVELERVKGTLIESKKMLLPGTTGPDRGAGATAALRDLWHPAASLLFAPDPADRVDLPARFVFDGRRLSASGGR